MAWHVAAVLALRSLGGAKLFAHVSGLLASAQMTVLDAFVPAAAQIFPARHPATERVFVAGNCLALLVFAVAELRR